MRFSSSAIAVTAAFVVCVHAADISDIPGYEALPEPSTNKYDAAQATVDPAEASLFARSVEEPEDEDIPDYLVDGLEPTHMPEEDLHSILHARSVEEEIEPILDKEYTEYYDEAGTLYTRSAEEYSDDLEDVTESSHLNARSIEEPETFDWDAGDLTEEEYQDLQARGIEADVAPSWQDDFEAGDISEEYYDEAGTLHKRSLTDDFEPGSISPEYYDGEGTLHKRSEDDEDLYYDPAHPGHDVDFRKRSMNEEEVEDFESTGSYEESEPPSEVDDAVSGEPATPAAAPTPKPTSANSVSKVAAAAQTTTGSQWTDVVSETAESVLSKASSAIYARNALPSHPRHRPYHATAVTGTAVTGTAVTGTAVTGTAVTGTAVTAASKTSKKGGFFKLPW